jgi:hypothetical protein
MWGVEWWWPETGWRLMWLDYPFQLYRTRREAREAIDRHMGYIRDRPDLRRPPFNWRLPRAVMVNVVRVNADRTGHE